MKRIFILLIPVALYFLSATSCVKDRVAAPVNNNDTSTGSRVLIDYWDFNSIDTTEMLMPNITINGASVSWVAAYYDAVTPGSTLNLFGGDTAGNGLRMRNPFTSMTLNMSTVGYKQPLLIFSAERSNSGPTIDNIEYTLDGSTFSSAGLASTSISLDTTWAVYSIDLSAIAGATNNPNFGVQFVAANNNTGTSGNDRYDNVTLYAYKQ